MRVGREDITVEKRTMAEEVAKMPAGFLKNKPVNNESQTADA